MKREAREEQWASEGSNDSVRCNNNPMLWVQTAARSLASKPHQNTTKS